MSSGRPSTPRSSRRQRIRALGILAAHAMSITPEQVQKDHGVSYTEAKYTVEALQRLAARMDREVVTLTAPTQLIEATADRPVPPLPEATVAFQ